MVKKSFDNLYFIAISGTCIVAGTLIFYINQIKIDKETTYFTKSISTLDIAYKASMEQYKLLAQNVFEEKINQKKILELFYKGTITKGNQQNLYRGMLYKELYPLYMKLKSQNLIQLHFHLKDGESFLRFNKPSKSGDKLFDSRESIKIANTKKIHVDGFETGRVISGFRNVFPINYKNQHIGSIEISLSTKAIIDTLTKLDKNREYTIIVNKAQINSKIFKKQKYLYSESIINADYLQEDSKHNLKDFPKIASDMVNKINQKLHLDKKLLIAMKNGQTYGAFVEIDNTYHEITFLPMIGLSNQIEGYLISYQTIANIPILIKIFILFPIIIIIATIIFIQLLLIIRKKSNTLEYQKQWFNSITDSLSEGLYVMNNSGVIEYANPMACKILGYNKKELIGKCAHNLFHSHYMNNHLPQQDCPINIGVIKNQEFNSSKEFFTCKDKKMISVDICSKSIIKNTNISQIVTVFRDISEKKDIENNMLILTKALETSTNTIIITDKNAIVKWANPAFEKLTGYAIKEIIGKNPKEFINSGKQSKEFYEDLWTTILSKKPWKNELINKKKDGTLYHEELSITPVLDENDEIQNFIAIKQDISERKKREDDVKHFAFYDDLTDLPNRRLLIEHLEQIINTLSRVRKSAAVLFLDLDEFKFLNDTYGHDAGDDLLIQVASRLNNTLRKQDIVARIGGDEFIIVLDDLPNEFYQAKEHTEAISKKIRSSIKAPFKLRDITYEITTSIGICIFDDELLKIDAILKRADIALYKAKDTGKDNICFYREITKYK